MPKTKAKKSKRKPNAAFMRPVQPDDKLSAIVGSKPLPRSELTKKLWDYIKKHGCQDKKKRTQINADDALRPVFNGKSQVSMFEMTKLVLLNFTGSDWCGYCKHMQAEIFSKPQFQDYAAKNLVLVELDFPRFKQ